MTEPAAGSSLLVRGSNCRQGDVVSVEPSGDRWKYISFRVIRLTEGHFYDNATGGNEVALVVIAGSIDVSCADGSWQGIGTRPDPFSGPPATLYLPASQSYRIHATTAAEVAICGAPARGHHPARLIALDAGSEHIRGEGQARRRVWNILMNEDEAGSLFLTEVITFPGNWSSYPPHKHDTDDPPRESELEELYYYRVRPTVGFAFQRVYTADGSLDETMTVHDNDVVLVPRGYHVCAAAAEYWVYYLNVLAGPKHVYHMSFDPAHEWIKKNWTW